MKKLVKASSETYSFGSVNPLRPPLHLVVPHANHYVLKGHNVGVLVYHICI